MASPPLNPALAPGIQVQPALPPTPTLERADALWLLGLMGAVACLAWYSLGLGSFSFAVPFLYTGDALQYLAVFRTILTTGWYTEVPALGAPFGALHYDTPVPDGLFLAFVVALGPFTANPAVPYNLLFIGGFFLVPAAFFVAARSLGVARPLAAAGALAYAWLPFHFLRLAHLFYTLYFLPPLVIACAVRLGDANLPYVLEWLSWRKVALFLLTGAAGVYNAYFLILVLVFCGAAGALAQREPKRLLHGLFAGGIIAAAVIANLVPTLVHQARVGPNTQVAQRNAGESEVYGLKLAQLVLPNAAHPIESAGGPIRRYNSLAPNVNENATTSLGLVGACGFLLALGLLLLRADATHDPAASRIDLLAKANGFVFLVATVGGLGMLFSLLVTPQLRALNRASVVIAAIALLALVLWLTRWAAAADTAPARRRRLVAAAGVLFAVWAIDQAPQRSLQGQQTRDEFGADARFVSEVAALLPANAMVLQLPYTEYPERAPHFKEDHYGLLRPYLHESSLRWSYGAMRGRDGDQWLRALSARPLAEQVALAQARGFAGIYVERRAYRDNGTDLERQLAAILGRPAVQRSDGATAFYPIKSTGGAPVELMPPPLLGEGFYGWERSDAGPWAWAKGDATIVLTNPSVSTRAVVLEMKLHTLRSRTVVVAGAPGEIALKAGEMRLVQVPLTLTPGANSVRISTPEPAVTPGTRDTRLMTFAIIDPRVDAAR